MSVPFTCLSAISWDQNYRMVWIGRDLGALGDPASAGGLD